MEENEMRKMIWTRKDAVEAKTAEAGFEALTDDVRDAWVVGLMLDLPMETALRCIRGEAKADELQLLRNEMDTVFKFGKRSALRLLKDVIARRETLKKPKV